MLNTYIHLLFPFLCPRNSLLLGGHLRKGNRSFDGDRLRCEWLERDDLRLTYSFCSEPVYSLLQEESVSLILDHFKLDPVRALKIYIDYLCVFLGAEIHNHSPKPPSQSLCCSSALQRHFICPVMSSDCYHSFTLHET